MIPATLTGLLVGGAVAAFGAGTGYAQWRGLKALRGRTHVPSDERAYFASRYRRRLLTGFVLVAIGLLIGGAYLFGLEGAAADLRPEPAPEAVDGAEAPKPEMTPEQKDLVRRWALYWCGVVVLVFALFGLALVDVLATRRYWLGVYRELRDDHQARLRRDLAVHKSHREEARNAKLRRGDSGA